jgi:hypothetical protein
MGMTKNTQLENSNSPVGLYKTAQNAESGMVELSASKKEEGILKKMF